MKILIVSDTHNKHDNLIEVIQKENPFDLIIHCGDVERGLDLIEAYCDCPLLAVQGNNDYFVDLPREIETMIGQKKVLITHGHYYYVSLDNSEIKREAISRGFDMVFFGHSHRPLIDQSEEITAVNPGSISYPRQEGKQPSYCIMTIDDFGKISFEINHITS